MTCQIRLMLSGFNRGLTPLWLTQDSETIRRAAAISRVVVILSFIRDRSLSLSWQIWSSLGAPVLLRFRRRPDPLEFHIQVFLYDKIYVFLGDPFSPVQVAELQALRKQILEIKSKRDVANAENAALRIENAATKKYIDDMRPVLEERVCSPFSFPPKSLCVQATQLLCSFVPPLLTSSIGI